MEKKERTHYNTTLDIELLKQLKFLSIELNKRHNDLIEEAIELLLKKYGKIVKEWSMSDLLKRFSEAAKTVTSNNTPIQECVYGAYRDHLSNIDTDDLPEDIQIIYESVTDRLTSVEPPGDIGIDEAGHLAFDILYMANMVKANTGKQ